ncbi:MAG: hypothetical protein QM699_09165 [Amaricoccus sp.]|uniref:hypothetical protein n=1 Tax=Amaricoccus sp. TaxID=1872485 RepID=UPI0039E70EC6
MATSRRTCAFHDGRMTQAGPADGGRPWPADAFIAGVPGAPPVNLRCEAEMIGAFKHGERDVVRERLDRGFAGRFGEAIARPVLPGSLRAPDAGTGAMLRRAER